MPISENEVLPSHKDIRPIIDDGIEKYIVESIVDKKKIKNKIYYLVKWAGYPDSANTLEPRNKLILDIPEMVKEFEKSVCSARR